MDGMSEKSQLPTWPTVTKSRFQIRVIYPIKVNLSQIPLDGEKIVPAAWKPGAVISLVSRWPREFLGGFASPWGNFHYRTGGYTAKTTHLVVIPKGMDVYKKWITPAKLLQCFFVGWDPSEPKMLVFFFNHGSSCSWFRYCNWSILQFLQILRLFNA